MIMSKSEKSAYFCHVFANNFFLCMFLKLFQRIQNQREILCFFYKFLFFCKKNFLGHICTFLKLWLQETAQKKENLFFMNVS